eukprot:1178877-Prorocentrum_minimum.AAC.3
MVPFVCHDDVAFPVHRHAAGQVELSGSALSVSMARHTSARQCGHQALRRNRADTMVERVRHNDTVVPVHYCYSAWAFELSSGGISISMTLRTSARQRGHQALRRNLANAMVVRVGHYNIAVPVHCHSTGVIELRGVAFSVSIAFLASARQCRHYCGRFRHIVRSCDRRRYLFLSITKTTGDVQLFSFVY